MRPTTTFGNPPDAVPDPLVGVDEAPAIGLGNQRSEPLFGYPRRDLFGVSLQSLRQESVRQIPEAYRGGYEQHREHPPLGSGLSPAARRADGTQFPVRAQWPMDVAEHPLVTVALRGLSDHSWAEADQPLELPAALGGFQPLTPGREITLIELNKQAAALTRSHPAGGGAPRGTH